MPRPSFYGPDDVRGIEVQLYVASDRPAHSQSQDALCQYTLSFNPSPAAWTRIYPAFANSVDPDQVASEEANWSGSALFAIQYANLYQQSGSSNLIGWKLEMGVAS